MVNDLGRCTPPVTNRGVQNTSESKRLVVDWFQFTIKHVDLGLVARILGLEKSDFEGDTTRRMQGFSRSWHFHDIFIFDGHSYEDKHGQTFDDGYVHVQMSGRGCRNFDEFSRVTWIQLFRDLQQYDHNISRVDFAIDLFTDDLTPHFLTEQLIKGNSRSWFRTFEPVAKLEIGKPIKYNTLYFGSPKSDIRFCFYDKKLEQWEVFNKKLQVDFWYRFEVRFKGDTAKDMIANSVYFELSDIVFGTIANKISFLEPTTDSNKSRWPIADYWREFTENAEPISVSKEKSFSIEKTYAWLDESCGVALAVMDQLNIPLNDIIKSGKTRIRKKHKDMMSLYNKKCLTDSQNFGILGVTQIASDNIYYVN